MKKLLFVTMLSLGLMAAQAQEPKKCCKGKKECSSEAKKECKSEKKACCKDKKQGEAKAKSATSPKAVTLGSK